MLFILLCLIVALPLVVAYFVSKICTGSFVYVLVSGVCAALIVVLPFALAMPW